MAELHVVLRFAVEDGMGTGQQAESRRDDHDSVGKGAGGPKGQGDDDSFDARGTKQKTRPKEVVSNVEQDKKI